MKKKLVSVWGSDLSTSISFSQGNVSDCSLRQLQNWKSTQGEPFSVNMLLDQQQRSGGGGGGNKCDGKDRILRGLNAKAYGVFGEWETTISAHFGEEKEPDSCIFHNLVTEEIFLLRKLKSHLASTKKYYLCSHLVLFRYLLLITT